MSPKYEASWNSLSTHPIPRWFRDAKFGIYTHWGPYSVPAYGANGTWYPHYMYLEGTPENRHHTTTYGSLSEFGYKDFIPLFKAEKFDPDEWAELFERAGAKFAGPVAEHHDGFSMWKSDVNRWNAASMGPRRDVVGELERAIRNRDMRFVVSFHHAHNWWYFPTWNESLDCSDPEFAGLYSRSHRPEEPPDKEFLETWRVKLLEVINGFRPDMVWFDFGLGKIPDRYKREVLAYYYNRAEEWGREVAVTFKEFDGWKGLPPGTGISDLEVGRMHELTHHLWLTDTSVDAGPRGTWSHVMNVGYKSPERLIHNLVDRVSKNGALLLNVGPRADGTIPEQAKECLLAMGKWLEVNGEAIFGTTPWCAYGEGPTGSRQTDQEGGGHFSEDNEPRFTAADLRFTAKGKDLYVTCLGRPGDRVTVATLKMMRRDEIESVRMLGVDRDLRWHLDDDGLNIETPARMPCGHAYSFKIACRA